MALIRSISGIRGTSAGPADASLSPQVVAHHVAAFADWLRQAATVPVVVIGRDARPSGTLLTQQVVETLQAWGCTVVDIGLTTTPTLAMAVPTAKAHGGIMLTASHNPAEWNGLKLLNSAGECLSASDIQAVLNLAATPLQAPADGATQGSYRQQDDALAQHIAAIVALPLVDVAAIRQAELRVAVDGVHSTGGPAARKLLTALGVQQVEVLYEAPTGAFPHNPEPLPQHLTALTQHMQQGTYHVGFAVDPDVDRLVVLDENGQCIGEEYTLVMAADAVLAHTPGTTVSNLSSTRALADLTQQYGGKYVATPVGEVHVVAKMKAIGGVIGGEGNGGVIYPPLHYGRDALVGMALILSHLARTGKSVAALKASYPTYHIAKAKLDLASEQALQPLLDHLSVAYAPHPTSTADGLRIDLPEGWVHVRASNTEPILRIYAEAPTPAAAQQLALMAQQQLAAKIKQEVV